MNEHPECYGQFLSGNIAAERDCPHCQSNGDCVVDTAKKNEAVKEDAGKRKISLLIPEMLDVLLPTKDTPAQVFARKAILDLAKAAHAKGMTDLIIHLNEAICCGKMMCQFDTDAVNLTCIAMEYGIEKYERNNWKKGMEWSRLIDAGQRHLLAILNGEIIDKDSGNTHLAHFFGSAHMLLGNIILNVGTNDIY